MTSTEFAARYRLLKNVATRGARSFLAQQVELGRMVMVHYLDSEKPQERAATLARLQALTPPARTKLLEIADVDGSPVAVTLFLSSFVDFTTWLDSASSDLPAPPPLPAPAILAPPAVPAAGDFTQAFQKLDSPQANIPQPPPNEHKPSAPPPRPAGDFTRIFGKADEAIPATAAAGSSPAETESEEVDSPTLIMEPPKAQRTPEPVHAPPPPPPAPSEGGFTAIFGRLNEPSLPSSSVPSAWPEPAAPPPPMSSPPMSPPSMAPLPQPALGSAPAKPIAPPSYPEPAQPGEFTQLFQRISPAAGSSAPSFAAPPPAPFRAPEIPRPIEPTPAADLPRPSFAEPYGAPPASLPLPSLGAPSASPPRSLDAGGPPSLGALPAFVVPPAPNFSDAPPPPNGNGTPRPPVTPPPVWGAAALPPALGSSLDVGVQSEFTRILGRVAAPLPPPPPMAPPQGSPAGAPKAPAKSMMPLLVALNVVVLLTIAIVAYFMFRKH
jgi:hypothetical protein